MIHIAALVVGLVVAVIRGSRPTSLRPIHLHFGWLIPVAFGIQLAIVYVPQLQTGGRYEIPAFVLALSYLILVGCVVANREMGGMKLMGLGLLLNFIVMIANGGFMPITPDVAFELGLLPESASIESGMRIARSKDILLEPGQTTLWALSDIFLTGKLIPIKSVFSIGDAISALGLFLAVQQVMLPDRSPRYAQPTDIPSRAT